MMIDTTLRSQPSFSIVGLVFAVLGALGAAFGVIGGLKMLPLAFLAAPFLLIGISLLAYRPGHFVAQLTEDAMEVMDPPATVRYEDIEWIRGKGRSTDLSKGGKPHYAMAICHPGGVVRVPAQLNVDSY